MTAMPLPNDDNPDDGDDLLLIEDPLEIVERLNKPDCHDVIVGLTGDQAQTVVDRLKAGADKYWGINPNRSLEMADTIIKIADVRDNLSHKALGLMARGDALKLLGNSEEAWDALGMAGGLYLDIGDEVGWARTRIGRIGLSVSVNRVSEALRDGERAQRIFTSFQRDDYLLRLDINTGWVYYIIGDHKQALYSYDSAIALAKASSENLFLGTIFINKGAVYCDLLGDYNKAQECFQFALDFSIIRNDTKIVALAKNNMAKIAIEQDRYVDALLLLHDVLHLYHSLKLLFDANFANRMIVECYLSLNRFIEARDLALDVIGYFHSSKAAYDEAYTLLHLASAEAGLMDLEGAQKALSKSEAIFESLGALTWIAISRLYRGQVALKQGQIQLAREIARDTVTFFENSDQKNHYAMAILLLGQVYIAEEALDGANQLAKVALTIAQQTGTPILRYKAHSILGRVAELRGDYLHAARRYFAAIAIVERVQQKLTISFQSEFIADKDDALHSLIMLYLQKIHNYESALDILERGKSQIFFNYISNRQLLRWPQSDPESQALIQELNQLRGEHHWWYQKAHSEIVGDDKPIIAISQEEALKELTNRERRMRGITEQLYLQGSANALLVPTTMPHLSDIQKCLDSQTLLIEFYQNEDSTWAFTINKEDCHVYHLTTSMQKIEQDIRFLHFNIDTVLNAQVNKARFIVQTLREQRRLRQLYDAILTPFASELKKYPRLIFVPYSSLHYVPFHLLHDGSSYLIEHHEVIIQPAAGYVTQHGPQRFGGARAIAHSREGALPYSPTEARFVQELFGGTMVQDDDARRSALEALPVQILHIAAHAEYRPQQPDLSYIELADGHLLTDDLLQQDMSYELVTLSACETARAHVAAGDELIGLGRGFLYAGAGALVSSLWRVADDMTLRLMEQFYRELHAGASKSAALRNAQLAILRDDPQLHPAFWGAFQLVGDPSPLSTQSGTQKPG